MRAEFAAMLHRFIEKYELVEGVTPTGLMGWIDPKKLLPPQTGDSASAGIWGFILLCSALACTLLGVKLRKRREDDDPAFFPA